MAEKKKHSPEAVLKKDLKHRPRFLAQQMTRELVLNGKLPQFADYGDHIARYGKGFSQMLNIASTIEPTPEGGLVMKSPRINQDLQHTQLSQTFLENTLESNNGALGVPSSRSNQRVRYQRQSIEVAAARDAHHRIPDMNQTLT
jgi:hypothetical protein